MAEAESISEELKQVVGRIKKEACRYYHLTGKPLGVTGEVAEYEAARLLNLELAVAREPAFDAIGKLGGNIEKIQIKGRAVERLNPYKGRVPKIKLDPKFDSALLVLLDRETMDAFEIWHSRYEKIKKRLVAPGSKSRNERGSMGISQFKSIADRIWCGS